jgi:hypothetical protein
MPWTACVGVCRLVSFGFRSSRSVMAEDAAKYGEGQRRAAAGAGGRGQVLAEVTRVDC